MLSGLVILFFVLEFLLSLFLYHLYFLRWSENCRLNDFGEDSAPIYRGISRTVWLFFRELLAYNVMIFFHFFFPVYKVTLKMSYTRNKSCIDNVGSSLNGYSLPILFIHGWGASSSNFLYLASSLMKKGFIHQEFFNYASFRQDIETSARQLSEAVNEVLNKYNCQQLILICHSMGGLVARYYIQALAADQKIGPIITLGSPHSGTRLGYIGFGDAARQMSPSSKFILGLKDIEEKSFKQAFYSLWSPIDAAIIPAFHAQFGKNQYSLCFGHVEMLIRKETVAVIMSILTSGLRSEESRIYKPPPSTTPTEV
ncbi:esterase/lipase family protein [candidate division CSSED10-310 bacterium]|uniref:Esterase/lipase family protein n=1 Tax=candidate division CSSED10-310 bacterium TaxID=2855610 RepID=A0ABV6YVE2_UNCC1